MIDPRIEELLQTLSTYSILEGLEIAATANGALFVYDRVENKSVYIRHRGNSYQVMNEGGWVNEPGKKDKH